MAKKRAKQWTWLPSSSRASRPPVDPDVRAQVEAKARELVKTVLKPRYVVPPLDAARFNYVTDVTLKWHSSSLFFIKVYTCPSPTALSPSFEARFARMRHAGRGKWGLSFMRYTGQWVELFTDQTVEACLASIRDDSWFQA
jgi:hypothetical protein